MFKDSLRHSFSCSLLALTLCHVTPTNGQVVPSDSLALVAIYLETDGANWFNNQNWLSGNSVGSWNGVEVANGRVVGLALQSNNLVGHLPPEVGDLDALVELRLNDNQLSGQLPNQIGLLSKTTLFRVFKNLLTGAVPQGIGNLVRLKVLDLSDNMFTSIPPGIMYLDSVWNLNLNRNSLASLPDEIGNLQSLEELHLDDNNLTSLPEQMCFLNNLQVFRVSRNQLAQLPDSIGALKRLKYLELSENNLMVLPSGASELDSLLVLSIPENLIDAFPVPVLDLDQISYLDLTNNQISGSIPEALYGRVTLRDLFLGGNILSGILSNSIGGLAQLRRLRLDHNLIGGAVPVEISEIAATNGGWSEIVLNSNCFDDLPDLSSIGGTTFGFSVANNKLTFEDVEPNVGISGGFFYAPQDSVGARCDTTIPEGAFFIKNVVVGGSSNVYQWYHDGLLIPGQTASALVIDSVAMSDSGSYVCEIKNNIATQLTLYSRPISLRVTSVNGIGQLVRVGEFSLLQNFPNPFNSETTIRFRLPNSGTSSLTVYNCLGQRVVTLFNQHRSSGPGQVIWNGKDQFGKNVASGVFLAVLKSGGLVHSIKIILLK